MEIHTAPAILELFYKSILNPQLRILSRLPISLGKNCIVFVAQAVQKINGHVILKIPYQKPTIQ
jgi:hypothetical protein